MISSTYFDPTFVAKTLVVLACLAGDFAQAEAAPDNPSSGALAQFDFLLGTHECEDVFTNLDGKRETLPSTWKGEYILGGMAIQDSYVNSKFHATNIRTYDPQSNRWRVTYFREPGGIMGVWEGSSDSHQLVLQRTFEYNGQPTLSRLVFDRMTADTFHWRSEYHEGERVFVDWTSDCQRTTH